MSPDPRVPFSHAYSIQSSNFLKSKVFCTLLISFVRRYLHSKVITLNGGGTKLREESLPTPRFTPAVFLQGLRGLDQTRISRARNDTLWWNKVEQNWYFASMVTHKRHFRRAGGSLTDRPSQTKRVTLWISMTAYWILSKLDEAIRLKTTFKQTEKNNQRANTAEYK